METLSIKKYNTLQTNKWSVNYYKALHDGRIHSLPQLAFYIFNKNYGYVAFENNSALWAKTKKEVIKFWEDEQIKKLKKLSLHNA